MEHGDAVAADAEIATVSRVAAELRQPVWKWYAGVLRIMPALRDGRFTEAERGVRETLEIGQAALPFGALAHFVPQMLVIRTLQGDPLDFAREYRCMFERHPDPATLAPVAWAECEAGRLDEAGKVVDRVASALPGAVREDYIWILVAAFLAEACAALDDVSRAALLYEGSRPYAPYWVQWGGVVSLGPAAHVLGVLARTLGRSDEAAAHFEHAIAETRRVGARPFLARSLYEYAMLLQRRDNPGDAARAADLLAEARAIAAAIGMAGLERKLAALAGPSPGSTRDVATSPAGHGVFRCEGDYWTIAYAGRTVRVRDGRGVRYLAQLLRHPGQEIPATLLASGEHASGEPARHDGDTVVVRDLGDAGPALDARAAAEYRRRVEELRAELAEAEERNDLGHAARARAEIEALCDELMAMKRDRRAASHAERARLTVTKGIKVALAKLAATHPALADHLAGTVKRGYLCVYRPDPRRPIVWRQ
jgi:tetratricopeptide (TPR) repeat protein